MIAGGVPMINKNLNCKLQFYKYQIILSARAARLLNYKL